MGRDWCWHDVLDDGRCIGSGRTRRALVQHGALLVLARCTRQRALTGAGAAQVLAGATYSITVSGAAYAAVGVCFNTWPPPPLAPVPPSAPIPVTPPTVHTLKSAMSTPTVGTMGASTIESRCRSTMSSKSYSSGHDRPACGRYCVDRAQAL